MKFRRNRWTLPSRKRASDASDVKVKFVRNWRLYISKNHPHAYSNKHRSGALRQSVLFTLIFALTLLGASCAIVPAPEPEDPDLILREELEIPNVRLGLTRDYTDEVREIRPSALPPLDVPLVQGRVDNVMPDEDEILQEMLNYELNIPVIKWEAFHPLLPRDGYDLIINDMAFARLFHSNLRGEPEPEIVKTLRYNEDSTVVELTFRDDFFFRDGSLLEAEDVLQIFELLCDEPVTKWSSAIHDQSPWTQDLENILAVEKIDAFGIRIYLSEPDPYLHYALTFPIFKRDQRMRLGLSNFTSSGPFGISNSTENQLRLDYEERFEKYRSQPNLRRVVLTNYQNNQEAQGAFLRGEVDLCIAWQGENLRLDDYRYMTWTTSRTMSLRFNEPTAERSVEAMDDIRWNLMDIYRDEALFKPLAASLEPAPYPLEPQHLKWQSFLETSPARRRPEIVWEEDPSSQLAWTLLASQGDLFSEVVAQAIVVRFKEMGLDLSLRWLPPKQYEHERALGNYDLILEVYELSRTPDPAIYRADSQRRGILGRDKEPFFYFDDEVARECLAIFSETTALREGVEAPLANEEYQYYYSKYLSELNILSLLYYNQAIYLSERLEGSFFPMPNNPLNGWEGLWKWSGLLSP